MCIEVKNAESFAKRIQKAMSPWKFFVLTTKYHSDNLVLHHLFKSKESKRHAHVRRIKAKESYFENFLHVICINSMEKQRKLVCSSQFKFYCVKANVIHLKKEN